LFEWRQCENYAIDRTGGFLLYFDDSPIRLEENNEVLSRVLSITRSDERPTEGDATIQTDGGCATSALEGCEDGQGGKKTSGRIGVDGQG
jgi:hypothetical protein